MAKANPKLSVGLIGVVLAGLVLIVASHLMMSGIDNAANKDGDKKEKKEKVELKYSKDDIGSIAIKIGDRKLTVLMDNNDAAQEFASAVPFGFEMTELNGNEKYYKGTDKLDTSAEEKPGYIKAGDLMLYGDDTIVLFYKDFPTEYSYTRLGWVQNAYELADLLGDGDVMVDFYKQ